MLNALGDRLAALDELAMSEIKMRVVSGTHWVDQQLRLQLHPGEEDLDVTVVAVDRINDAFTLVAADEKEVRCPPRVIIRGLWHILSWAYKQIPLQPCAMHLEKKVQRNWSLHYARGHHSLVTIHFKIHIFFF